MQLLQKGQFFGETNRRLTLDGLTITDTEYTHEKVDWHYHENPYFTFILQGQVIETNRKETYHCSAGSLLFHNWDDAHYNIKPPGYTRGFHIEMEHDWFTKRDWNTHDLQGSFSVKDPDANLIFYQLFKESLLSDNLTSITTELLLLEALNTIKTQNKEMINTAPSWINPLRELLHEQDISEWTLSDLSELFSIHPVHLSRYFPKFFGCSLGEYIRKIKIKKALHLLSVRHKSLAAIALESGFSDQSHFNRCFKEQLGITPLHYRKFLQP
ncbi:helix-turn-helix transcriptional regulator [Flavobacterium cerinum]|uniref:Helix-turn-helix transcriptional regulator n=1 Tax=Flavobacterium cerinum TaxID=2502784 RepID=A0ABY5IQN2_9FLAO|nr:helix-turn-helix transcriptional regulator [Flavobacterium cerinum]UUC44088.1 helix-turn-helix transcriptional regulator [Flavobacterium cerinum]